MREIKDIEWAYMAGLIDADGCIQAPRGGGKNSHWRIEVHLIQKELNIIDNLWYLFGGSVNVVSRKHQSGIKHYYRWQITGPKCKYFLIGIEPYLILKKKQALLGIELGSLIREKKAGYIRNLPLEIIERREQIAKKIKSLNSPATTECDGSLVKEMRQSELTWMKNRERENRSIFPAS